MILGFWDYHRLQGRETLQATSDQFQISSWQLWQFPSFQISKLRGRDTIQLLRELHKDRSDASSGCPCSAGKFPGHNPHGKGGDKGIPDLVGVAPGVVAPEEINNSVHTHGTAARHGGGNISLCLALLPAKPGWNVSPAPRGAGWVYLEGFNDSSSPFSPPFQM